MAPSALRASIGQPLPKILQPCTLTSPAKSSLASRLALEQYPPSDLPPLHPARSSSLCPASPSSKCTQLRTHFTTASAIEHGVNLSQLDQETNENSYQDAETTVMDAIKSLPRLYRSSPSRKAIDFNLVQKRLCELVRSETNGLSANMTLTLQLIKVAIEINEPFFTRRVLKMLRSSPELMGQIGICDLTEIWRETLKLREPTTEWLDWFCVTVTRTQKPISRLESCKVTKLLGFSLGVLIRSARGPQKNLCHLNRLLQVLNDWENISGQKFSPELYQRRTQLEQLLGVPRAKGNRTPWLVARGDPYTFSTVLRAMPRVNPSSEHLYLSKEQILGSMRVICRSKGHLIGPSESGAGYQLLTFPAAQSLLSSNLKPSIRKTGLKLGLAEALVARIRSMLLDKAEVGLVLEEVERLLSIQINSADVEHALYGGTLERNRLRARQSIGLQRVIENLLGQPNEPDFALIFELVEHSCRLVGSEVIRAGTLKALTQRYLHSCSTWCGASGLERLLDLLIDWAVKHSIPRELKLSKILPGDRGLVMIDRLLFPEDLEPHDPNVGFEKVVDRLKKFTVFIELYGSPRRYRGHRLKRLIYLNVINHRLKGNKCSQSPSRRLEAEYDGDLEEETLTPAWWNRTQVWQELETILSVKPPALDPFEEQSNTSHPADGGCEYFSSTSAETNHHPNQLDKLNEQLRHRSKNYFSQHSIVVCVVQMMKDWVTGKKSKSP